MEYSLFVRDSTLWGRMLRLFGPDVPLGLVSEEMLSKSWLWRFRFYSKIFVLWSCVESGVELAVVMFSFSARSVTIRPWRVTLSRSALSN